MALFDYIKRNEDNPFLNTPITDRKLKISPLEKRQSQQLQTDIPYVCSKTLGCYARLYFNSKRDARYLAN